MAIHRIKCGVAPLLATLSLLASACDRPPKKLEHSSGATPSTQLISQAHVQVFPDQKLQTIEGLGTFGTNNFWWNEPPYFDEDFANLLIDEVGVSMSRIQIYWDGEAENDNADPSILNREALRFGTESKNGRTFPWLRELGKRNVPVIATVWTPPSWMKEGANNGLASFCHGQCGGRLKSEMREEFAEYLLAATRIIKEETDVSLYALSIQNEPIFENPFESCVYTAEEYAETLRAVQKRFSAEGLKTRFFGPEHIGNWQRNLDQGLPQALLSPRAGHSPLHAYAVHGYHDGVNPDTGTPDGWVKAAEATKRAGVKLWMTETSTPSDSSFEGAREMSLALHRALKHGQVTAWIYWYLAEQKWPANKSGFGPGPLFNELRHYFKVIRPGSVQLKSECELPLHCLVMQDQKQQHLIVHNTGSAPVTLHGFGDNDSRRQARVSHWQEGDSRSFSLQKGGKLTLPPRSLATISRQR